MKLILFDVDGTLTPARKKIKLNMVDSLKNIKQNKNIHIGFVGGSDFKKQIEQLTEENLKLFDWKFSENGLLSFHKDICFHKKSFVSELGDLHFKKFINICLSVLSEIDCPVKRGTFIEFRNGMINLCPVGRACDQEEREQFYEYDKKFKIREEMINNIKKKWDKYVSELNDQILKIKFSIGGQISVDVFPEGWDKTYCLQFVENKYDEIHFFGDKTYLGGNDYEIYNDSRVIGHKVQKYQDTIRILNELF